MAAARTARGQGPQVESFGGDAGYKNNAYQVEHDALFDAIRNDKPYNEAEYGATVR